MIPLIRIYTHNLACNVYSNWKGNFKLPGKTLYFLLYNEYMYVKQTNVMWKFENRKRDKYIPDYKNV